MVVAVGSSKEGEEVVNREPLTGAEDQGGVKTGRINRPGRHIKVRDRSQFLFAGLNMQRKVPIVCPD
jgi:hypothetical protein